MPTYRTAVRWHRSAHCKAAAENKHAYPLPSIIATDPILEEAIF